jgi:hypothetical protein
MVISKFKRFRLVKMLQTCERKMEPCMQNEAVQNIKGINKCQMERNHFIFSEVYFFIL